MSERDLCFLTTAHGSPYYEGSAPLFLYSITKTYPEATAIVFLAGEPLGSTKEALKLLANPYLKVIPNEFKGYNAKWRSPAMWRFLLFTPQRAEKYFRDFEYFFTTDVDYLICPEVPSLVEQHLRHCKVMGLPYSASVRHYEPLLTVARLFATRQYVDEVGEVTLEFDKLVRKEGVQIFDVKPRHPDERMLYLIAERSGLRPLPRLLPPYTREKEYDMLNPARYDRQLFNPQHGLHLGCFRSSIGPSSKENYRKLFAQEWYKGYFRWLLECKSDPLFQKLLALMPKAPARAVHNMLTLAKEFGNK